MTGQPTQGEERQESAPRQVRTAAGERAERGRERRSRHEAREREGEGGERVEAAVDQRCACRPTVPGDEQPPQGERREHHERGRAEHASEPGASSIDRQAAPREQEDGEGREREPDRRPPTSGAGIDTAREREAPPEGAPDQGGEHHAGGVDPEHLVPAGAAGEQQPGAGPEGRRDREGRGDEPDGPGDGGESRTEPRPLPQVLAVLDEGAEGRDTRAGHGRSLDECTGGTEVVRDPGEAGGDGAELRRRDVVGGREDPALAGAVDRGEQIVADGDEERPDGVAPARGDRGEGARGQTGIGEPQRVVVLDRLPQPDHEEIRGALADHECVPDRERRGGRSDHLERRPGSSRLGERPGGDPHAVLAACRHQHDVGHVLAIGREGVGHPDRDDVEVRAAGEGGDRPVGAVPLVGRVVGGPGRDRDPGDVRGEIREKAGGAVVRRTPRQGERQERGEHRRREQEGEQDEADADRARTARDERRDSHGVPQSRRRDRSRLAQATVGATPQVGGTCRDEEVEMVYLHGHAESVLRSHGWRTAENSAAYLLPELRPGLDVLDVGCGPGTITADLAGHVAPGRVIGIDTAREVLLKAAELAAGRGVDNVLYEVADVMALPYGRASFDVVHAHQVLQHLADPVGALREMRRVLRPGGVLAVRDADYGAMRWYPEVAGLEEWRSLYCAVARADGGAPDAGRRLLAWVREAGFEDVTATATTWCFADEAQREWWSATWADRITRSRVAERAMAHGLTGPDELEAMAAAWREWGAHKDGVFYVLHGEVLART